METPQETLAHLPHAPGVYLYRDNEGTILYIGKAKDLKRRVSQYWSSGAKSPKTDQLVSQIASIETMQTASELDALLLEAKLIHTHMPKYNVVLKDDKSPLYILLTLSERLPHVLTLRRTDLPKIMHKKDALFGPFQSANVVRSLLRQLRHSVPYCTQRIRTGKPCFYSHIGLCKPCPSDTRTRPEDYRKNIYRLKALLSGTSSGVIKELEHEMIAASKDKRFEDAAILRNHIQNLYRMLSKTYDPMVYMTNDVALEDIHQTELTALGQAIGIAPPHRIECYDISNTSGKNATGSMVVLTDGTIDKSEYKRFRIRRTTGPNDFAMMKEVMQRRLAHPEWGKADLIVIDGGKGQLSAVRDLIVDTPYIGLAKRFEEILIPEGTSYRVVRLNLTSPGLHILQRIRDEAHRFAITYHRLLRKKSFATIRLR